MKKIIYIVFFLISFKGLTQNIYNTEVTYKVKYHFDLPYIFNAKLIFNNSTSYYIKGESNAPKVQGDKKIIKHKKKIKDVYNTNLKTNLIFLKTFLNNRFYLQKEKITKIPWEIDSKSKGTILGYKCKKATGLFRGRVYTVWFTTEIPVKFGPWKLNGLPGLILEVKDTLNQVTFTVEKIEHLKEPKKFDFDFPKEKNKYPVVSLKEGISIRYNDLKNKIEAMIAKLPRGTKVIREGKVKKAKNLELKYEWEK